MYTALDTMLGTCAISTYSTSTQHGI